MNVNLASRTVASSLSRAPYLSFIGNNLWSQARKALQLSPSTFKSCALMAKPIGLGASRVASQALTLALNFLFGLNFLSSLRMPLIGYGLGPYGIVIRDHIGNEIFQLSF